MIVWGTTSLARIATLTPNMQKVMHKYAEIADPADDAKVLEGVRSREQMAVNYGKGRTAAQCLAKGVPAHHANPKAAKVTWLNDPYNSPHAANAQGKSRAVDVVPFPIDWNSLARFDRMAETMFRAAELVGVQIRWGADWDRDGKPRERGESDSPHFEEVL